ncbi:trimethylamine methyltransferase family protein [Chloroflexota bacterium]
MIKLEERRASIQPIKSKLRLSILSDEEIKKINETAYNILENVGVFFPSDKALRIFADAKANVDFDKKIVKIPSHLISDSLKKVPKRFTLAGRRPELDIKIGENNGTYFYCSGTAPNIVDFETGEKRTSTKSDVGNMAKIADYLPIVSLTWPTVSSVEKGLTAPIHEVEACFNNTEKHVQTESVMDEISAKYTIEMASVIAGGKDKLRERPIHALVLCGIAPLTQDRGGIESALAFAEAGLPVGFQSMPTMGLTAPPYQAADLAIGLAEVLSGCVLTQIAYPGAPLFITIQPAVINPRSGDYLYGSSFSHITSAAAVQLAHSNGLSITSQFSFGGSAHKLNNWQIGRENVYGHLLSVMAGADMSFGPSSLIEAVNLLDMSRILFDREIFQAIDIVTKGIEVNEETLALDMIREIGPRGNFLGQRRTAEELPKLWPPSILFEKSEVLDEKYRNPEEVAHEVIDWILKNHHPAPLAEDVRQELRRIVDTADQDENLRREIKGK